MMLIDLGNEKKLVKEIEKDLKQWQKEKTVTMGFCALTWSSYPEEFKTIIARGLIATDDMLAHSRWIKEQLK